MPTDWEQLHSVFYGNINEGIYQWLGSELGVSAKALRDLQIGWAPMVQFKSGKTGYGFFTIPMRDATGRIIGLGLRTRDGDKITYPGSTPGCIYVVNPSHRKGEHGYSAGSHNWTRTSNELVCPLCGKPDGCLVSAENTADPKAVICRVQQSDKPMKFGWLHILKQEGQLDGSLIPGTEMVLLVEGMSDTAAAADLGFTAIGRPSDLGGQDILGELVRGRSVLVIGENDLKSDGKWPGRDGMVAVHSHVRKFTPSAKMLMPPPTIKDLRSWVTVGNLTAESFKQYAESNATDKSDKIVLPDCKPVTIAEAFLKDTYVIGKRYILRRWEDCWYHYHETSGRYEVVKDPEIRAAFYGWSRDKKYEVETPKGVKIEPLVITTSGWSNFVQAGESFVLLTNRMVPAWINGASGPEPKNLIVFSNGILDVPSFLEDRDGYLLETTPDFFNTTAIPLAFNPAAPCPTWLSFLQSAIGDEPAKIELLQEWFGYCLTPDTTMQKLMYFRGESGGGKGTILHVLESLVGKTQSVSTSFADLAQAFGLSPLIGKLVAIIPDARRPENSDAMRGLEILLNVSGDDAVQVNRKFKDQLEGARLTCRVTIAGNDFLDVPDYNGAMKRRLNVIQFSRRPEFPDIHLKSKLDAEIEGIAVWALAGLKRLRECGQFTVPVTSIAALQEWERDTNPIKAWMLDCLQQSVSTITGKDELFDCWQAWARETRRGTWTRSLFFRRLVSNASYISDVGSGFKGIEIIPAAAHRYLGRPR